MRIIEIVLIVVILRSVISAGLRYLKKRTPREDRVRPGRFSAEKDDIVDAEYKELK